MSMAMAGPSRLVRPLIAGSWAETLACRRYHSTSRDHLRSGKLPSSPSLQDDRLRRHPSSLAPVWPSHISPNGAQTHLRTSLRHLHTSVRRLRRPPPSTTTSTSTLPPSSSAASTKASPSPESKDVRIDPDAVSKAVSESSQAKTDWTIILKLAENIWPKGATKTKVRVLGALALLIGGKVLNVQVPFFFKQIVDSLNVPITENTTVWVLAGASIAGCAFSFLLSSLTRTELADM